MQKMLKYDPADRISAKAALEHPYFDSLDKSQFWICFQLWKVQVIVIRYLEKQLMLCGRMHHHHLGDLSLFIDHLQCPIFM